MQGCGSFAEKQGFTLVELSIVLVIIGLLIGGVIAGQSLIRAAELRSVSTEYQRYVTALYAFRDKYMALPGDMKNATAYWGTAAACPGDETQPSTTTATCNGDGSGTIGVTATSNEVFRFWQHLANAGMIEGQYSGVRACSSHDFCKSVGVNAPASKMPTGVWNTHYRGVVGAGHGALFAADYGNMFTFGEKSAIDQFHEVVVLKPEDAWNIDSKIDDGKSGTGKVIAVPWTSGCTNATSGSDKSASYAATSTAVGCALNFTNSY